jgi:hypothetical protein
MPGGLFPAVHFEVDIRPPNVLERASSEARRVDDQRRHRPEGS